MNIDRSRVVTQAHKDAAVQAEVLGQIAQRRWQHETGGITVQGLLVNTERDSQALITGATLASVMDPSYICNWKTAAGWVPLNAAVLAAVSQAIRAHVQACFDREGQLVQAVQAGTFTPAMLDQGWPTGE